jgi:Lon protease-like protein
VASLPAIIPLFPLPNLVLFPGMQLPLHIFEPRYREMVADVARDHRIVGMILLKGDWESEYYRNPDTFEVGCAGRIEQLARLPDGRYNLILSGISEFRIERELRERAYRQAQVQWCAADREALDFDGETMKLIHRLLVQYAGPPAEEAWHNVVGDRGLVGADLINFLCFHLDFSPLEKQTLLEAGDHRVACLLDVFAFKIEERKLGPAGGAGNTSGIVQ